MGKSMDLQDIVAEWDQRKKIITTAIVFLLSIHYIQFCEGKPPVYEAETTTPQEDTSTSQYEPLVLYVSVSVVAFLIVTCCIVFFSCCFWWKSKKKERQQLVYRTIYPTYNSDGSTKSPLGLVSTDLNKVLEKKHTDESDFKTYDHLYIAENPNFKFQELQKEPKYKEKSTQN